MLQEVTSGKSATKKQPLYERHAGFHVLRLSGDDYEIGYQHGSALKSAMATGPVPYFERYVERMLAAGAGPKLGELLSKALALTVGRRIQSGFPPHTRRALDGLADGAGLDRKQLLAAVTMPESYLWVLQQVLRLRRPRLAPHHGVPLMGCTSAVAWGDATRDGSFLHGRNFDYQGVGAWDTEQAIVFHRPTGAQPYVSVSAAGILFGGITAMNASGITLVVHQHMASTALQLGGTPIGVTGDQVMRHAKSLDDARRILDSDRQNGCWTYVIGSAKEGAVLCYETTPARSAAHVVSAGTFGYSNFYLDRELARTERELYPSHWRNNLARYRRANARLEAERGRIDADTIAGILGDPGDESCRIEEAISQLMTVASVVFEPSAGMFYVATGRAPTSNNEFVAFSLDGEAPAPERAPLTGGQIASPERAEAFHAYRDAYDAYFSHQDVGAARKLMARAVALQPEQPLYHYIAALLALSAQDAAAAEASLDAALALGHSVPEREASLRLWRARARDLRGRRADANGDYRAALSGDPAVRRAAERGLKKRYTSRRFGIEFALADVPVP
ncbi:MAG: hypothetical protein KC776_36230 [Myxococcales bacterium]|nr:hypothetical protein [Myxococcales bacterium]MCB9583118.1 hypothetical protein [Polyangiaceae bacterium]